MAGSEDSMIYELKIIDTAALVHNEGQVKGVPRNPRLIEERDFDLLKDSIERSPEYLHVRPLIVYPLKDTFVVLSGNMRFEACKALGLDKVPCKVLKADTAPRKMRAYITKENLSFGQDDPEGMKAFTQEELQHVGKEFYLSEDIEVKDLFEEAPKKVELKIFIPKELKDDRDAIKGELEKALKSYADVKVK